jgi:hypothetical protein
MSHAGKNPHVVPRRKVPMLVATVNMNDTTFCINKLSLVVFMHLVPKFFDIHIVDKCKGIGIIYEGTELFHVPKVEKNNRYGANEQING